MPCPPLEQLVRPVVGLGLDVLRQADGRRTRRGGVGEHSHRPQQRVHKLLGSLHTIEETGHRAEGVVHRHVTPVEVLELLKHRVAGAGCEDVRGKEENRNPVDGGRGRPGQHVRGTRADRREAGESRETIAHAGKATGGMDHRLLVARLVVAELARPRQLGFEQGLRDAGQVPVAEYPEAALDEPVLHAVPLAVLSCQEPDQGLTDCQAGLAHVASRLLV